MNNVKNMLNDKRTCTGGMLFMVCSLFIVMMIAFCVGVSRNAMARSVAESVEHTIALECLASCYTNPGSNFDNPTTSREGQFNDSKTFAALGTSLTEINPVREFNDVMTNLNLMAEDSQITSYNWLYKKYNSPSAEGYDKGQATFELQVHSFRG